MNTNENTICSGLNNAAKEIHENAVIKGFWNPEHEKGTMLMLCVSELAEALEADRKNRFANVDKFIGFNNPFLKKSYGDYMTENAIPSFETTIKDTFEDEIADTVIRILDMCGAYNIDIEKHIDLKVKYNSMRGYLHGKKY